PRRLSRWPVVPSGRLTSVPLSSLVYSALYPVLAPLPLLLPRPCPCRLFSSENGTSVDCFAFAVNSLSRHPESKLSNRVLKLSCHRGSCLPQPTRLKHASSTQGR
ncbi:hypothetical protein CORC01_12620, partial [Colletotrichum orchidophilum]